MIGSALGKPRLLEIMSGARDKERDRPSTCHDFHSRHMATVRPLPWLIPFLYVLAFN